MNPVPTNPGFKNYAFISYSRKDEKTVAWLHSALEKFRIPTGLPPLPDGAKRPKHLRPVFRDKKDLEYRPDSFVRQIEAELPASRFLIVMCSPNAAQSHPDGRYYVDWEIRQFIQAHGADYARSHILPVVLAGKPGCGDPEQECLPPALLEFGPTFLEHNFPLLKDLPEDRRELREAREDCVIGCVAFLLGVARTTIYDRHLRAQRERMRNYLALAAGVALALAGLTCWAVVERSRAEAERVRAETERNHAETARQVAESAKNDAVVARDLAKSKQAEAEAEKKRADEQAQVAIQQRDRANAARVQAEALVDSLTFQLRDRLNAAGNLAVLQEMNDAVERYHQSRDAAEQGKFDERTTDEMRRRAASLVNQADALIASGEADKAAQCLAESMKQFWALMAADPMEMPAHARDLIVVVERLGDIMVDAGKPELAEKVYLGSLDMYAKLADGFPDSAPYLRGGVFVANVKMGRLKADAGQRVEAKRYFEAATSVAEQALAQETSSDEWEAKLGTALSEQGQLVLDSGAVVEARSLLSRALDVERKVVARKPDDVGRQFNLRCQLAKLGNCEQAAGEWDQAIRFFEEDSKILSGLVAVAPENLGWREALAVAQKSLGFSFAKSEKGPEAMAAYKEAVSLFESLVGKVAATHDIDGALCEAYANLGRLSLGTGMTKESIAWNEKADRTQLYLSEKSGGRDAQKLRLDVVRGLATACIDLRRLDEAMAYQKRLLPLARAASDPGLVDDLFCHMELALQMERYDEAVSAYTEAKGMPDVVPADLPQELRLGRRFLLGWCGILAGSFPAALDDAQSAVALVEEAGPSPVRMNYAHACLYNGRYVDAEAIYRKYLGQEFSDGRKWNDELRNDIEILRCAGRDHPDLKKVEAMLCGTAPADKPGSRKPATP